MSNHNPIVVECRGVTKEYKKQKALDDMSITVRAGEVFGFLGPNGAGKTTLIKIMLGLVIPNAGEISIFGKDIFTHRQEIMRQVGAVVEAPIFFEYMTGYDNLFYLSSLSAPVEKRRVTEVLEMVGLGNAAKKRVGAYSYGMKQRLGIAQALIPDSKFMILDEPTNGLDPQGIKNMRELVRRICKEQGKSILLSSHLLGEVEQLCDRVTIINKGKKIIEGTVAELKQTDQIQIIKVESDDQLEEKIKDLDIFTINKEPSATELHFKLENQQVPDLIASLVQRKVRILEVYQQKRTLEDIFIESTGKSNIS